MNVEIWKVSQNKSGNLRFRDSETWKLTLFCMLNGLELSLVTIALTVMATIIVLVTITLICSGSGILLW